MLSVAPEGEPGEHQWERKDDEGTFWGSSLSRLGEWSRLWWAHLDTPPGRGQGLVGTEMGPPKMEASNQYKKKTNKKNPTRVRAAKQHILLSQHCFSDSSLLFSLLQIPQPLFLSYAFYLESNKHLSYWKIISLYW